MLTRVILGVSLLFFAFGCKQEDGTITATVGTITESVYASGVVKAAGQYQVYSVVNGQVIAILVNEGDTVKAGQALLHIDDRASSLTTVNAYAQLRRLERNVRDDGPVLAQLRATVTQAKDKLAVDSLNYQRQKALWEQKIGSRNDLDQRELANTTSKAAYERAAKALQETRESLRTELEVARNNVAISSAGNDDRTPRSLIDGIVYDLMIEPGELATTQKPLAIIGSATDLYLELEVDEYDIRQVKPGQLVHITLDSYKDTAFAAEVTRIIPIMDERSRTFKVEARFKQKPATLYPNFTVEGSIVLRTKEDALLVPASYVVDGAFLHTDDDERTPITIGLRDMQNVEVLEGIDANTRIYKPE